MPLHMEQQTAALCKITNLGPEHHTGMFAYFQWCVILPARLTLYVNSKFYLQYNGQIMPSVI